MPTFDQVRKNFIRLIKDDGSGTIDVAERDGSDNLTLGAAVLPARGTAFPASPGEGQQFYRTDLDEMFFYDSSRSKWLGTALIQYNYAYSGTLASANYLRGLNGITNSDVIGNIAPYDLTLVGIHVVRTGTGTVSAEIYDDGALAGALAMGSNLKAKDMTLDVDIAEDSVIAAHADAAIANVQMCAFFRRHEA